MMGSGSALVTMTSYSLVAVHPNPLRQSNATKRPAVIRFMPCILSIGGQAVNDEGTTPLRGVCPFFRELYLPPPLVLRGRIEVGVRRGDKWAPTPTLPRSTRGGSKSCADPNYICPKNGHTPLRGVCPFFRELYLPPPLVLRGRIEVGVRRGDKWAPTPTLPRSTRGGSKSCADPNYICPKNWAHPLRACVPVCLCSLSSPHGHFDRLHRRISKLFDIQRIVGESPLLDPPRRDRDTHLVGGKNPRRQRNEVLAQPPMNSGCDGPPVWG